MFNALRTRTMSLEGCAHATIDVAQSMRTRHG